MIGSFCDRIAREASELNLKLIKWRLLPDLDLERIWQQRCLLIGAGTLGCNVARCLLAWGVRKISLVDNGRISYSNPVRQSLFVHGDCGGSPYKALVAAQRLQEIDPSCEAEGYVLGIPMPGHHLVDGWREDVQQLESLILQHDAIFLLTDSRESRWLPALLGAAHQRLVLTAALGFDSWMVMRHGYGQTSRHLSCYFCSDNVGPRDSLSNRTLDQQCTVSRPGASYMAAATAVELLASILQHPLGPAAPASDSILGAIPHQIRGFLGLFQTIQLTGEPYSGCIACSPDICKAYLEDGGGLDFVQAAIEKPDWMWSITEPKRHEIDEADLFEACEEFD